MNSSWDTKHHKGQKTENMKTLGKLQVTLLSRLNIGSVVSKSHALSLTSAGIYVDNSEG